MACWGIWSDGTDRHKTAIHWYHSHPVGLHKYSVIWTVNFEMSPLFTSVELVNFRIDRRWCGCTETHWDVCWVGPWIAICSWTKLQVTVASLMPKKMPILGMNGVDAGTMLPANQQHLPLMTDTHTFSNFNCFCAPPTSRPAYLSFWA